MFDDKSKMYDISYHRYFELDADTRAAEYLCRHGIDGRSVYYDLLMYAKEHLGYEGDDGHGTLQERIDAASRAPMCKLMDKAA
jgi:hypothetical protein